jgi:hypothetical protein
VKRSGVWAPVKEAWVKRSGVWTKAYEWDLTPSSPPEISLEIMDGRYIKVGVRLPDVGHDTDLALIRVLVGTPGSDGKYSGSYLDTEYISRSDNTYPDEPWSEYYYNGYKVGASKDHNDSSVFVYKQYPLNPTADTNLKGGQYYRFSAWSMDTNGNWSVGTNASIMMPKTGDTTQINKSARVQANSSGTYQGDAWTPGDLYAANSPRRHGFWFYGSQVAQIVGQQGTPTIKNAQIFVNRTNDDGVATANVYVGRSNSVGSVAGTQPTLGEVTKLGTISKGQGKWFDLPSSWYADLTGLKSIGLWHQDPAKAAANADDFIQLAGVDVAAGQVRSGELYLVWSEKP